VAFQRASDACRVLRRHTSVDVEWRKEKGRLSLCTLADGARRNMLTLSRCDVQWWPLGAGGLYESGFGVGSIWTEGRLREAITNETDA